MWPRCGTGLELGQEPGGRADGDPAREDREVVALAAAERAVLVSGDGQYATANALPATSAPGCRPPQRVPGADGAEMTEPRDPAAPEPLQRRTYQAVSWRGNTRGCCSTRTTAGLRDRVSGRCGPRQLPRIQPLAGDPASAFLRDHGAARVDPRRVAVGARRPGAAGRVAAFSTCVGCPSGSCTYRSTARETGRQPARWIMERHAPDRSVSSRRRRRRPASPRAMPRRRRASSPGRRRAPRTPHRA